jgi:hypothetical protein
VRALEDAGIEDQLDEWLTGAEYFDDPRQRLERITGSALLALAGRLAVTART